MVRVLTHYIQLSRNANKYSEVYSQAVFRCCVTPSRLLFAWCAPNLHDNACELRVNETHPERQHRASNGERVHGCDAAGTGCRVQCGRAQSARARCVRAGKGYRAQCRRARGERTKIPRTFRVFTAVAKKTKTLNYILNQLTKSISAILSLCAMFNCWLNNTVYTKYRSFSKDNFFV